MALYLGQAAVYLTGAGLSYLGTAIVQVAMSFAVLDTGHGAGGLGLVLAAQTVPTIVLVLLGGVMGDRWPRRRIMIGADVFRASAQAVLAGWLIFGRAPLGSMVVASALIGIGNAFFQPASGGFLPQIMAREQLGRANGLLRTENALAMVIGPAIGGGVAGWVGPGWGIALDAASYLASAVCLFAIRVPAGAAPAALARQSVLRDMIEAVKAMRATRWLWLIIAQYAVLNMLAIGPFNVIAPVVLSRHSAGAGDWGILLSSIGVGAVGGALVCARRQPRRMLLGVEAAASLLCLPIFLLAIKAPFVVVVAGGVAFGAGAAMLSVLTMTAIQMAIAPAMLSRIMAVVQLANMGLIPVGYVLAAPALGVLGASRCLAVSGFCVLGSVALLCCRPEIRGFVSRTVQRQEESASF